MERTARGVATKLATLLVSSDQYSGRPWEIVSMITLETVVTEGESKANKVQLIVLDPIELAEYEITVRRKSVAPVLTAQAHVDRGEEEPPF